MPLQRTIFLELAKFRQDPASLSDQKIYNWLDFLAFAKEKKELPTELSTGLTHAYGLAAYEKMSAIEKASIWKSELIEQEKVL